MENNQKKVQKIYSFSAYPFLNIPINTTSEHPNF